MAAREAVINISRAMRQRIEPELIGWAAVALLSMPLAGGCAGKPAAEVRPSGPDRKLASVGLERLSDLEAHVPAPERGRYVPCRVIRGFPNPALPEHPAGYLIVRVEGQPSSSASEILAALADSEPGQRLRLVVRRNPYLDASPEWWESTVTVTFPASRKSEVGNRK
jgi:S1-C subfamily serine protease